MRHWRHWPSDYDFSNARALIATINVSIADQKWTHNPTTGRSRRGFIKGRYAVQLGRGRRCPAVLGAPKFILDA